MEAATAARAGDVRVLNLRDFGAVGDGVTDDTDAIRRAIEDVKGYATPLYKLKKRLIEKQWNITIVEISA